MIFYAGLAALVMIALAFLLAFARLLIGPETLDRVLALDTLTVCAIAFVVVGGILLRTTLYFEAALLFAMVGFLGTVAFAKYLMRGDVIE